MRNIVLVVLALVFMSTGCASSKMKESAVQEVAKPAPDVATIIFVRASMFGGAIQSVLYESSESGADFIGILSAGKKVAYNVSPGKHTFMVVSEAADFMEANVDGGKTYYAIVTPRMGAWKARFSLFPVRNGAPGTYQIGSDEFNGWMSGTEYTENTPESHAWALENESSILEKMNKYQEVWGGKSTSDLAERTLNPEDGI